MGINWRGALRGAATGVGQVSGLMITEEVAKTRDARMAQFRQEEMATDYDYRNAMQNNQLEAQGIMTDRKIAADQAAQIARRAEEVADMDRSEAAAMRLAEFKAQNDPRASNTTVTVGAGDNEFTKALDKDDAATYTKLREAATSAGKTEATLNVLEQIGAGADTGFTPDLMAQVGQAFGTKAAASRQAYQAAVTPLILDQTSKLEGVISDKDMEVIKSSMPSFATDPRANKIIIGIIRKGMQDAQTLYAEADAYLKTSPNYSLRGWVPSLSIGGRMSDEGQSSIDAADKPMDVISGFKSWRSNR